MRNSEKLAAIKNVLDPGSNRITIQHTTELDGVINRIDRWPEIHRALSVLVGYTDDAGRVPGLIGAGDNTSYITNLIERFPPSADNFPRDLIGTLQNRLNVACQELPTIIRVLEQVSPELPDPAFMMEFPGKLSLSEFETTISELKSIVDILKIGNDVEQVWTDFGSSVFGLEFVGIVAPVIIDAVISGAEQFRNIVASFNPETALNYLRLFNQFIRAQQGEPLDERIVHSEEMGQAIRSFAGGEVTVGLIDEVGQEQRNGIGIAIPRLAEIVNRGWNVSNSLPNIEHSQITHSTIIIANTVNLALPSPETDATPRGE